MSRFRRLLTAWREAASIGYQAWPLGAVTSPLAAAGVQLTGPLVALALGFLVNGVADADTRTLALWGTVVVAVVLASEILSGVNGRLQDVLSFKVPQEINRRLMRVSLTAPGLDHLENPGYADRLELVRSRSDVPADVFLNLAALFGSVVSLVVALTALTTIHPLLALAAAGVIPGWLLHSRAVRRELEQLDRGAHSLRLVRRIAELATTPAGGKELRMHGLLPLLREDHRHLNETVIRELARARRSHVIAAAAGGVLQAASLAVGIAGLTVLTVREQATPGELAMGIALLRTLVGGVGAVGEKAGRIVEQGLVAERYLGLLDYQSPVTTPSRPHPAPEPLREGITFDRVSFTYPGTHDEVLHDVSLTLPAGATVALVGENGAGKTTLIKLLARLYDPTVGRILVDGTDLRELDPEQWRAAMSAAFQDYAHFQFRAGETIGIGDLTAMDDHTRVTTAAEHGGAVPVIGRLPDRYRTQLGRQFLRGVELSEGEWQKMALSRSLMRTRPLTWVLDEPTASLDAKAEHEIFHRFAALAAEGRPRGGVVVLVSHRFSTVRMADLIIVLHRGRIEEAGTHEQLLRSGGRYAHLFTLQAAAYE